MFKSFCYAEVYMVSVVLKGKDCGLVAGGYMMLYIVQFDSHSTQSLQ